MLVNNRKMNMASRATKPKGEQLNLQKGRLEYMLNQSPNPIPTNNPATITSSDIISPLSSNRNSTLTRKSAKMDFA